jgi:hypothetical protein
MLWIAACYCALLGICPAFGQQNGVNPDAPPIIDTVFLFATDPY